LCYFSLFEIVEKGFHFFATILFLEFYGVSDDGFLKKSFTGISDDGFFTGDLIYGF
jgi:hypothetical protein